MAKGGYPYSCSERFEDSSNDFDRDGFFYENPGQENERPVRPWVQAFLDQVPGNQDGIIAPAASQPADPKSKGNGCGDSWLVKYLVDGVEDENPNKGISITLPNKGQSVLHPIVNRSGKGAGKSK